MVSPPLDERISVIELVSEPNDNLGGPLETLQVVHERRRRLPVQRQWTPHTRPRQRTSHHKHRLRLVLSSCPFTPVGSIGIHREANAMEFGIIQS